MDGRNVVGPRLTTGEIIAVRLTVLLKPFNPFTVMVNEVEEPLGTVWEAGLAVIVKSGVTTVNFTTTE